MWRLLLVVISLAVVACGADGETAPSTSTSPPADLIVLDFEFIGGSEGWAADVSDFSDATRPDDVLVETGVAPEGFGVEDGFFHLAATNRSDDLFQYLFREVGPDDGLAANAAYEVSYVVRFASNAPTGCAGVGGAPGESVWMKVGASAIRPAPVQDEGETYLPVDKGRQSDGGSAAEVAGDIANGIPCEEALEQEPAPYAIVTHEHTLGFDVASGEAGSLWLFVGVDSGFESRTSIYYDRIEVTLSRVP